MHPDERNQLTGAMVLGFPVIGWTYAVKATETLADPALVSLYALAKATPTKPALLAGLLAGAAVGALCSYGLHLASKGEFAGAVFRRHLRGTRIVSTDRLKTTTRERGREQVTVAGVPMPTGVEQLHALICGSTGSGKSVLLNELVFSALARGDRAVIADPNGSMYAKFGRAKDIVLNPYDARSQGWSFFNEIRNDFDFERYALSLVPRGQTREEEEWRSYARLLLQETARKLDRSGNRSIQELFRWTTIAQPDDLKTFLHGTAAESLFVGADKALASARFVLSTCLPGHLKMPPGDFSLRDWLDDPNAGNLYLTWREDMAEALKPLLSAWVDVLCTSILSLPEDPERRPLWLVVDELASLEKLPSLEDAATKGRKAGLRLVAGLQSTSQLDKIYGQHEAQTLRSCFRSTIVLSGSKSDPKTCEDMSRSLGEHEVERYRYSRSTGGAKGPSTSRSIQHERERVVLPSEISSLPPLTGYVAFAGDFPIARIKVDIMQFCERNEPFVPRVAAA